MGKFLMRCVNLEVHLQTICCDVECVYFKNLRAVRVIQSNSVINVFNKNTLKDNLASSKPLVFTISIVYGNSKD